MFVTWLIGYAVAVIIAGIYCERHGVDTAAIGGKVFVRSIFWPLFVVNGIIWGLGLALAVAYGHCIAPAARERFKVR